MNNEIANKVFEMLEQIAEQLGVAAEKLYPILLKQARIDAYGSILELFAYLFGAICFGYLCYRIYKMLTKKLEETSFYDFEVAGIFTIIIAGFIEGVFIIGFILSLASVKSTVLTPLLNPDWYILNELLANLIK